MFSQFFFMNFFSSWVHLKKINRCKTKLVLLISLLWHLLSHFPVTAGISCFLRNQAEVANESWLISVHSVQRLSKVRSLLFDCRSNLMSVLVFQINIYRVIPSLFSHNWVSRFGPVATSTTAVFLHFYSCFLAPEVANWNKVLCHVYFFRSKHLPRLVSLSFFRTVCIPSPMEPAGTGVGLSQ